MKDAGIIAKRYAEALFNLCLKEKNLGVVEKSFDSFVNETTKNTTFVHFMESPVIPHKSKEAVLEKIIPQGMPPLLVLFLKLVLAKKRFEVLTLIEKTFQQRSERYRGVHRAELTTAVAVELAAEKKLTALLEKKFSREKISASEPSAQPEVILTKKVDPKILGGFILKWDELVVDASYQTKLREMKQRLYATAI